MCLGNENIYVITNNFSTGEIVNTDARKTVIKFQPIGVIGSIMPWNFPYWQALRFGALL